MVRLVPKETAVVVIDVQERLHVAMLEQARARVEKNVSILLEVAARLGAPVLVTEQYPKGLGPTIGPLRAKLQLMQITPIEKACFCATEEATFARALAATGARSVVLVGEETHICVFQTARALAAQKVDTWVLADAVASRTEENRQIGLDLCREAGAKVTATETVVFDWLGGAGTDDFKFVSKLVR